jgi:hypothetical protein
MRPAPGAATLGPIRELATPAAAGSGEANLTTAGGVTYLSWIEPGPDGVHALRFSTREAGGEWSAARTIAQGRDWFVNWADFPAMAALPDGTLAAHWLVKTAPATYAYEVRVALSRDGGASWGEPIVPHRDGKPAEHGFVSFFPWEDGRLGLVWLDGRHTGGHAAGGPGAMALMQATLGTDGARGEETTLDARVCDCCQTSAARTGDGVLVAYRDRSEREIRDVATVRYAQGRWSQPVTLGADGWEIHGCPVNGPAVAAVDSRAAVAWFSAPGEQGRVQVAFSADAGRTFGAPIRVDDGRPLGRVDVALLDGDEAVVSWLELGPAGAEVRARTVAPGGTRGAALTVAPSSEARSSGFPRIERAGGELLVAWRDSGTPSRVRTAVVEVR